MTKSDKDIPQWYYDCFSEFNIVKNLMYHEIESLKSQFSDGLFTFYKKNESSNSLRRNKVVKYIKLISDLIDEFSKTIDFMKEEDN